MSSTELGIEVCLLSMAVPALCYSCLLFVSVGYGDMVPSTDWGYLVGACCAVSGVLMVAFTVPIMVNNFILFYQHVQYRKVSPEQEGLSSAERARHLRWSRFRVKTTKFGGFAGRGEEACDSGAVRNSPLREREFTSDRKGEPGSVTEKQGPEPVHP